MNVVIGTYRFFFLMASLVECWMQVQCIVIIIWVYQSCSHQIWNGQVSYYHVLTVRRGLGTCSPRKFRGYETTFWPKWCFLAPRQQISTCKNIYFSCALCLTALVSASNHLLMVCYVCRPCVGVRRAMAIIGHDVVGKKWSGWNWTD